MKAIYGGILTALIASVANAYLPVDDNDFGCITRAKADQYVSDFNINVSSFGGMELCNGNSDTKKLFNDLQMVEEGSFSGGDRNLFIRNIIPTANYFSWLKEQTGSIRRGHDMPTATAYNSFGNFTMQDGWAKLSTLGRVGTLIHEARHTEGYSHTQCRQGPYRDAYLAGCDSSLSQQGSHGVEMEYYSRVVLQGQNFHPVYTQMARLMNLGRANFVFNDNPMAQKDGLIAAGQHELIAVDSDLNTHEHVVGDIGDLRLKRTSFGATLYKGDEAFAVDLYQSEQPLMKDEFSYFKLLLDGRITDVADMQEVDVAGRRYMVALTQRGQLHTYIYAEGRWSAPSSAADVLSLVTTAPDGSEGLFVVSKDGTVYPLNPGNLRKGSALATKWPQGVVDFANWRSQRLAVETTGRVVDLSSGKAYSPLEGYQVQQLVRAPYYNAFGFEQ